MANARNGKRRLSLLDASFLYAESMVAPTHGGAIFVLEGELPYDQVLTHMRQRLHLSPRFRQRLVFAPFNLAHPTLEDDPDFKLENHVRHQQLPSGISEADAVQEIVRQHFGRVMDRTRPLWDVILFEGVPGRSLLVWAMHHALVDGVSGFEMLNGLMDFTPNPPPSAAVPEPREPAHLPSMPESFVSAAHDLAVEQIDQVFDAIQEFMRDPTSLSQQVETLLAATRLIGEVSQPPVATPWNGGITIGERHLAHLKTPFAGYRAIRAAFGGTINDIVLAVLGEGAARYLKHHGWPTDGILRFGCPVNVRRPGEEIVLENRVSAMMPSTPAAPLDMVKRLKSISEQTARLKQSGAAYTMERMMSLAAAIPPALLGVVSALGAISTQFMAGIYRISNWRPTPSGFATPAAGISFVATNVPGPQTPWYFAGHKVTDMFGLLPLPSNIGYGVGISSYDEHIIFSMMADALMIPDVDQMKVFVQEAFDDLIHRVPVNIDRQSVSATRAEAA
ncbi:MAG: wax ester/triacylglycerol synthase family O-acyltransferase [Deltaproteobacteria bacterium]|nr:wax ester/triacylglycerol synthase family O-acyltransferase [Deltaproteobacteria bacterium]